jgi:hypothetical protein
VAWLDVAVAPPAPALRVILDMDLDGLQVMQHIGVKVDAGACLPVIAVTRRGDLKTKHSPPSRPVWTTS